MTPDGTGRSNALPVVQLVLGGALLALGLVQGLSSGDSSWVGWVLAMSGAVQIVSGVLTLRRNDRLDRLEHGGRDAPPNGRS